MQIVSWLGMSCHITCGSMFLIRWPCRLRLCLCLAALACILRPTNVLVWMTLASVLLHRGTWDIRTTLIRESIICG